MHFEPDHDGEYRVFRSFAERWAYGALRQAQRFREALNIASQADRAYQLREDELPDESFVAQLVDEAWVEQHLLAVAAHQFETWTQKMLDARGSDEKRGNELVRQLRNVLEHLDEAAIEDEHAVPNPALKRRQSLENLPGGRLPLGMTLNGDQVLVCDLVPLDRVEEACRDLIREVFEEIFEEYNDRVIDAEVRKSLEEHLGRF